MVKVTDWVHARVVRERRRPTVDHGHHPGGGSPEIDRNGVPVRGTSPRLRKNGEGLEVSLTGGKERVAEGRTQPSEGGEQLVVETLGGGGAADSEALD
jgi:hypothetical protein